MNAVQQWQPKPKPRTPDRLFTARYTENLTGQAYRDMHAALLAVARMADAAAETTEALFTGHGLVLVVRYARSRDDGLAEPEYVTVEPGSHLYYSQEYDHLGEETDGELAYWYDLAGPQ